MVGSLALALDGSDGLRWRADIDVGHNKQLCSPMILQTRGIGMQLGSGTWSRRKAASWSWKNWAGAAGITFPR